MHKIMETEETSKSFNPYIFQKKVTHQKVIRSIRGRLQTNIEESGNAASSTQEQIDD